MQHLTASNPALTSAERRALDTFLSWYDGHTRVAYEIDLRLFLTWLAEHDVALFGATRLDLEDFARHLIDKRGNGLSTMRRRMHAVRRFYALAHADGLIPANPALFVRLPRRYTPDAATTALPYLDRYELAQLLDVAKRSPWPAEAAMVALLALMGLRVSEATGLSIGDYRTLHDGHRVLTFVGKGGKPARIPLTVAVLRLLDRAAGDRTTGPLLIRRDGTAYPYRAALRLVQRLTRDAGIDKHITPHALRRSFVSACLDAGVSLRDTQTASRHADPRMVLRYDQARHNLDRHAVYAVTAFVASAS